MNDLSWLIYWADAAPNLSTFVAIASFLLFVASLVLLGINLSGSEETRRDWNGSDQEWVYKYSDAARVCQKLWFAKILAPLFFVLWGASFLVPSKDTFYMIAASEAGEEAVQTPEFTKVRKVLNKWLDDQLSDKFVPEPINQQPTN